MPFDMNAFEATTFKAREDRVKVPRLKKFFGKKEKPVWIVRGLTGSEVAETRQAVDRNVDLSSLVDGLVSKKSKDKAEAVKEALGITDRTPDDLVRRLAALRLGSVDPPVAQNQAVKLATAFPEDFYNLTNRIFELTGLGQLGE